MQFLGRLLDTVSTVSSLFSNPYRVRDVQLSEYNGNVLLKKEGRLALYRNQKSQSWDCLLLCPETPSMALRMFQVASEGDAMNWFPQYALKLRPFYEMLRPPLKPETFQAIVDCLRNHPDWSSAHITVEIGLRDCLKHNYILSQMNARNSQGQTPLHLACERGDVACVRELLEECQARTDVKDKNGETPMHCAAKQDSTLIIEALCARLCAGVNEVNVAGETPLHIACRLGRVEAVKGLLVGGARCDIMGSNGYPIHTAMKFSEKSCAEAILSINPNQLLAEDPLYGGTPLHWAKTAEMCRLLLDRGCNLNYLSKTGESPLHILTKRGRFEAAMKLLTHGADPNIKGQDGNTALHLAMKLDHMNLIKALMVFGADVEIHNDLGETPGLIAARTSKGFDDIMYGVAAVTAMSRGFAEVDGLKTGSGKTDKLLCLDGGGIKGLVLIQILIALEKEARRPIRELFDWVSGTSTGGILALAIVHGKSVEYLRCLYFRMKEEVFKGSRPYESGPLEEFLKNEFGENTKMTDVTHPRVMVTSVLADRHPGELHLFRNYNPPALQRDPPYRSTATFQPHTVPQGWEDEDILIIGYSQPPRKRRKVTDEEQLVWRAARSSGAAPTYFRPMGRFLDGALLANNPTLDAMTEIHQFNKDLKAQGREAEVCRLGVVVSLGTGKPPQVAVNSVDVFRPSNPLELAKTFIGVRELGKMLVDCCTDSDGCAVDRARAWCEMTDINYHSSLACFLSFHLFFFLSTSHDSVLLFQCHFLPTFLPLSFFPYYYSCLACFLLFNFVNSTPLCFAFYCFLFFISSFYPFLFDCLMSFPFLFSTSFLHFLPLVLFSIHSFLPSIFSFFDCFLSFILFSFFLLCTSLFCFFHIISFLHFFLSSFLFSFTLSFSFLLAFISFFFLICTSLFCFLFV
ncbi:85/88 kDa calcium-independent phospholipase A2-like isoform X3 [Xyrauchen texanus]|uniref:85/88 kDa calcium-independent phospholipase A2-like isoform X3 n=1 Tax=Xyrauchen texanus TaxID=154827 RepID=UPI002241E53D|nr:85/88 kDa calcium-independent phospholipase A2-like isoform X3 [Xyrauchen texanus]